ncbi:MAG: ASPIC/UnbV domain-containing protein, partial [Candidatus Eiseniibacteriota bacterium]
TAWHTAGRSYCSQSEEVITFGLGGAAQADEIEVRWPSGKTSTARGVAAGSRLTLREAEAAAASGA